MKIKISLRIIRCNHQFILPNAGKAVLRYPVVFQKHLFGSEWHHNSFPPFQ